MKKFKVTFQPANISIDVEENTTISSAALKAGLKLRFGCPGKKPCGLCRVKMIHGKLSEPSGPELDMLTKEELDDGIRLACRTVFAGDAAIELQKSNLDTGMRIEKPLVMKETASEPYVFFQPLTLNPPSLSDNLGDLDRVLNAITEKRQGEKLVVETKFLTGLSKTLRDSEWNAGAVLLSYPKNRNRVDVLDVIELHAEKIPGIFGIALDVGTTTIAGYLVDLNSGKVQESYTLPNPQVVYGADVITRLQFCKTGGSEGLIKMQEAVLDGCRRIIHKLCNKIRIDPGSLYLISLVGNTVMEHLLLGINPIGLSEAPYTPISTHYPMLNACDLGLIASEGCSHFIPVCVLPGTSGYLGADAVSCALVVEQELSSENGNARLVIDIGTNGEVILLLPDGRILGCSSAAGPAFEGAHVRFGMPPLPGAISKIDFEDGRFKFDILGKEGTDPVGFTGSALIDLLGILVDKNVIDKSGKLADSGTLGNRVRTNDAKMKEFVLTETDTGGPEIILTQEDIRQVQLAKSAICAGIEILLSKAGIEHEDVGDVYLAGAFGSKISVGAVSTIGIIPEFPKVRLEYIGNAAGAGAVLAMISKPHLERFYQLADNIEYVELATAIEFNDLFVNFMNF